MFENIMLDATDQDVEEDDNTHSKWIIRLELSKLSKNKRYRLNCTTLKNKNIYWFGKMIIKEKGEFFY